MDELSKIKRSIQNMASKNRASLYTAKVTAVHGDVCDVDIEGLKLSDVKLCAVSDTSKTKLTLTPKTGSYIVVADLSGEMTCMVAVCFTEVESISVNGGELGGLVKIEELVKRLNGIETAFNDLLKALKTYSVTDTPSGTVYAMSTNLASVQSLDQTQQTQIEDDKIKH